MPGHIDSRLGPTARTSQAIAASAFATIPAIAWVALTAASGRTYHLAPMLIAASPGAFLRAIDAPTSRGLAAAIGLGAAALSWLTIVLSGIAPVATVLPGQPGGVLAEIIAAALIGATGAALLVPPS